MPSPNPISPNFFFLCYYRRQNAWAFKERRGIRSAGLASDNPPPPDIIRLLSHFELFCTLLRQNGLRVEDSFYFGGERGEGRAKPPQSLRDARFQLPAACVDWRRRRRRSRVPERTFHNLLYISGDKWTLWGSNTPFNGCTGSKIMKWSVGLGGKKVAAAVADEVRKSDESVKFLFLPPPSLSLSAQLFHSPLSLSKAGPSW